MERLNVNTGVRLTLAQVAKLEQLATTLRISRNRVFGMLIDGAKIESKPALSVGLKNNGRAIEREDCTI